MARRRKTDRKIPNWVVAKYWKHYFPDKSKFQMNNLDKLKDVISINGETPFPNMPEVKRQFIQMLESGKIELLQSAGRPIKPELQRAPVHKSKSKEKISGKHPHFTGQDFYASKEWREARYMTLARFGRVCLCCGWRPHHKEDYGPIHIDHIKPRSKFPELALDPENLSPLCAFCNLGKSNKDDTDFRSDFEEPEQDEPDPHWMDAAFSGTIN